MMRDDICRRAEQEGIWMLIYGHRGASATEPENTLRSFQRALEIGADGIEIDVQVTSDRIPIILHDRNLERTTNETGPVDLRTLESLENVDAGNGERIPTLAQTLELIGDRAHIDVEIKQGGIETEVLDALSRFPESRWAISSFDWTVLEAVRARSREADLWVLAIRVADALFHAARHVNASGVSLYAGSLTDESATRLRDAGLDVVVWTVNDPTEAIRAADLGAAGLCTDDPATILTSTCAPPTA
jgi:glycerophosphoryl diester phosphodiesterase